jgi:hypothetical protein
VDTSKAQEKEQKGGKMLLRGLQPSRAVSSKSWERVLAGTMVERRGSNSVCTRDKRLRWRLREDLVFRMAIDHERWSPHPISLWEGNPVARAHEVGEPRSKKRLKRFGRVGDEGGKRAWNG